MPDLPSSEAVPPFTPFRHLPRWGQWSVLVVISILLGVLLKLVRLPAALLLGPMVAAILMETGGGKVQVPRIPYRFAQAIIGCMIARVLTAEIMASFLHRWPLFLGVVLAVIAASCAAGFFISKFGLLPDTTAVWGLLPGAASTMMLMAEAFGADMRLVAFMQYLRVVCVAVAASLVGRFWAHAAAPLPAITWFPPVHGLAGLETAALILAGVFVGPALRLPASGLLLPMFLGAGLHGAGLIEIELPPWLLAMSYLLLGWSVGLRFTRPILARAFHALPQILLSIVALMAFCGLIAGLLVWLAGIDPLTAYLATSPGGADSAAVIAASSPVDVPFVMALQTVRFLLVLLIGPPVSRWLAGLLPTPKRQEEEPPIS